MILVAITGVHALPARGSFLNVRVREVRKASCSLASAKKDYTDFADLRNMKMPYHCPTYCRRVPASLCTRLTYGYCADSRTDEGKSNKNVELGAAPPTKAVEGSAEMITTKGMPCVVVAVLVPVPTTTAWSATATKPATRSLRP
jgi:hypothetical protein